LDGGAAQNMPETTMKTIILTIFATALFAGSMIQAASAGGHHRTSRAYRTAPVVVSEPFRDSYASDYGYWASRTEGGAISAPAGR
jgi:hypothetical protein